MQTLTKLGIDPSYLAHARYLVFRERLFHQLAKEHHTKKACRHMPRSADLQYNPACSACQVNSLKKFALKVCSLAEVSLTLRFHKSYRQFHDNVLVPPCQVFFAEISSYESISTDHPPALFELTRDFFLPAPKLSDSQKVSSVNTVQDGRFSVLPPKKRAARQTE